MKDTFLFNQLSDDSQSKAYENWLSSKLDHYHSEDLAIFLKALHKKAGVQIAGIVVNTKYTTYRLEATPRLDKTMAMRDVAYNNVAYALGEIANIGHRKIAMSDFDNLSGVRMALRLYNQLTLQKRLYDVDMWRPTNRLSRVHTKCYRLLATSDVNVNTLFTKKQAITDKDGQKIATRHFARNNLAYVELGNSEAMPIFDERFDGTELGQVFVQALKDSIMKNLAYPVHAHVQVAFEAVLYTVLGEIEYHESFENFSDVFAQDYSYHADGSIAQVKVA